MLRNALKSLEVLRLHGRRVEICQCDKQGIAFVLRGLEVIWANKEMWWNARASNLMDKNRSASENESLDLKRNCYSKDRESKPRSL